MLKKITLALAATSLLFAAPVMAKKPEASGSIVDIVVSSPDHTVLEDLVIAFDLVDLLDGPENYTVFAPTDAAFAGIAAIIPTLADCQIAEILAYHVTDGRRFSNSVVNANNPKWIEMLNGGFVTATPGLMLIDTSGANPNGPAMIETPNLAATNGVVHSIDQVIIPDTFADCVAP